MSEQKNTAPQGAVRTDNKVRSIAVTGVLSGVAFVLQLIEFPVPMFVPPFIKFDFSVWIGGASFKIFIPFYCYNHIVTV